DPRLVSDWSSDVCSSDLAQYGFRLKSADPRFKVALSQPDRLLVCFARLCSPRLTEVSAVARIIAAHKFREFITHLLCDPENNLQIGLHPGRVSGFMNSLQIPTSIREGSRF